MIIGANTRVQFCCTGQTDGEGYKTEMYPAMAIWTNIFISCCAIFALSTAEQCFSGKLDLVLVVDVSGSVDARFNGNQEAALEVVKSLPIGWDKASVSLIQYSKDAIPKLEFSSSQTQEMVVDAITSLEWVGDVAMTAEAMDLAMIQFRRSRPDAQRVIVLCSDGNSLNSWKEASDTAERLNWSNATIYAISMNGNTYDPELHLYVDHSNGSIVKRQSDMDQLKRDLRAMTVPHCPPPAAKPPQDFLRPAEANPDAEERLPTRPGRPGDAGSSQPTRRPTRRHTASRATRPTTITPSSPAGAPTGPAGPAPPQRGPAPPQPGAGIDRRN